MWALHVSIYLLKYTWHFYQEEGLKIIRLLGFNWCSYISRCVWKKMKKNKVRVKKKLAGLGFIKLTGKIIYVGLNFYNFLFIAYNSCDIDECQLYRKSWTRSDGWGLGEKIWKNQSSYSFYILHLIKRFYKFYIFHSIIIWWQKLGKSFSSVIMQK